ncbi:alpha/beta fold hydrolase [Mycoplasma sp. P36-A1]|uniref:alpha/beta fold hydrolase n=1 Tax=Mycoplasma sp. P36-A1 TaxID=3252900 RepID=UPI003C2DA0F6
MEIKNKKFKYQDMTGQIFYTESDQELPVVFFYHGWSQSSNSKRIVLLAEKLAENDFIVVLPDALMHGGRDEGKKRKGIHLWPIITKSNDEFNDLCKYISSEFKVNKQKINIAGFSMGAITSLAIFKNYDFINSCIPIAATASPIGYSTYLIKNDLLTYKQKKTYDNQCHHLPNIDITYDLEVINKRHLHFIHGKDDGMVNYHEDYDYYLKMKDEDYASKTTYDLLENTKHELNDQVLELVISYLKKDN